MDLKTLVSGNTFWKSLPSHESKISISSEVNPNLATINPVCIEILNSRLFDASGGTNLKDLGRQRLQ